MNIVLVGAWWTGISSLGFLLSNLGYENIVCIDANSSQITQALKDSGLQVIIGHWSYEVKPWDVVIYSDACPNAPEVEQAKAIHAKDIKNAQLPYSYFQFLWEISKFFETIAVAGTHGKSTTSALLTYTMKEVDPKFALGILWALVPQLDQKNYWARLWSKNLWKENIKDDVYTENIGLQNTKLANVYTDEITEDIKKIFSYILFGKNIEWDESLRKKYRFVIEADEFNRHFLYLDVDYAIVLNAELDHSDIYPSEQIYLDTFVQFINKVKKETFALSGEIGMKYLKEQCPQINLIEKQKIDLPYVFGDHNQKNASLILALLETISKKEKTEFWKQEFLSAMEWFRWLWRRIELLAELRNNSLLYSDYWHHPTEIKAVYEAMRTNYPEKKLTAIFQPHQARRVLQFWEEFTNVMKQFDEVIIYDIYVARENIEILLQEYAIPDRQWTQTPSVDELWDLFAQKSNGRYSKDSQEIIDRIQNTKWNEVICLFTAWNLDYTIRNKFSKTI